MGDHRGGIDAVGGNIGMLEAEAVAATTTKGARRARRRAKKTAVIVVHGMGEQRPMETLWGLVRALWSEDRDVGFKREVWSKPEGLTKSYELRRVTTSNGRLENNRDKRVDFFEFYWAHLMTGNTVQGVTSWLFGLLFRRPRTVPPRLVGFWIAGLVAYGVFGASLLLVGLAKADAPLPDVLKNTWVSGPAAVLSAIFGVMATRWLAPVAGDAARYLSATPDNVAARQVIREAGVELLDRLQTSGRYDRIVILGHSLGSVVAYDVLNCAWGRLRPSQLEAAHPPGSDALAALAELEVAAGDLTHADGSKLDVVEAKRIAYRDAQRTYAATLRTTARSPWLVSDFVTVGSPLSKADVLLAVDANALEQKKGLREIPTCPPTFEVDDLTTLTFRFSFPADKDERVPHHGAVFGPTVWTNIYFPSVAIAFGDMISGACAPLLGRGVRDISLKIGAPVFRHLDYWKEPNKTPPHPWITALRKAVNLRLQDEATLWSPPQRAAVQPPQPLAGA